MINYDEKAIPAAVRRHLRGHDLDLVIKSNHPSKNLRAEVCLLRDREGLVQAFVCADSIAEPNKIRDVTGRDLRPLSIDAIQKLKRSHNVETLPALDNFVRATTLIDQRLYQAKDILMNSGAQKYLIKVPNGQSLTAQDDPQVAAIATPFQLHDLDYNLSLFEQNDDQLRQSLSQFTALRIRQRLDETLDLPPLSKTTQDIIKLRIDPHADIDKLSKIVQRDPSLSAQVVGWANSSYYSAPGSIKSIQDAIFRVLGYDTVVNLALGISLSECLTIPEVFDKGAPSYWQQAVYVATCAGELVSIIPREFRPSFGLCYLAGLLHNFGNLVLAHSLAPYARTTHETLMLNRHLGHQHIEKHMLNVTREQIAASLTSNWQLPIEVTTALRYQNEPHYLGPYHDMSMIVYVAKHLLREYGLMPNFNHYFDPLVYEELHLDPAKIPTLMSELVKAQNELDSLAASFC